MNIFKGSIDAKTDVKGRVFVPASFRKILQSLGETSLILRKDVYKNCLTLHPENIWNEELYRISNQLNMWNEKDLELFRKISSSEESVELDSNGRILIPKKYLQFANITNTISFVGMIKYIDLWDPEILTKTMLNDEDFKSGISERLGSKPANEKSD